MSASQLPADLAERLELPAEILPGSGCLTLSGGRRTLVEGHRGILEYTGQRITVSFGRQKLSLSGDSLQLRAMNAGELLVVGRIRTAEWE